MATVTRYVCDGGCGREAENPYAIPGWVRLEGQLTRAWGVYANNAYQSDFLDKRDRHFCSMECLIAVLDRQRTDRHGPPPTRRNAPRCPERSDRGTWCQHDAGHSGQHTDLTNFTWGEPPAETAQTSDEPSEAVNTSWRRLMEDDDATADSPR